MDAEFKADLDRNLSEYRDRVCEQIWQPWLVSECLLALREIYCVVHAGAVQEDRRGLILMLGSLGKTDESCRKLSEKLYEEEMTRPPELM